MSKLKKIVFNKAKKEAEKMGYKNLLIEKIHFPTSSGIAVDVAYDIDTYAHIKEVWTL